MGLWFVSPGMKLHSKSSLAVSFISNSHSLCSWLNSSLVSAMKTFRIFPERYMTGRLNRSFEELFCLSNAKFRVPSSWNDACHREISFHTETSTKLRSLFQGNIAQKASNCHSNFCANFPGKNKERNSHISLALLLHNTVNGSSGHNTGQRMTEELKDQDKSTSFFKTWQQSHTSGFILTSTTINGSI